MGRKSTNKADYLSVTEFAKLVGKSSQSLYKKMKPDNRFWRYVQSFNGTKMIHKSALYEVYGVSIEDNNINQPDEFIELPSDDNLVRELKERIAEQSRTIDELHKALASAHESLQNEQKLHGITQARLKALEDKQATHAADQADQKQPQAPEPTTEVVRTSTDASETVSDGIDTTVTPAVSEEPQSAPEEHKKKWSFWRWLLGF